MRKTTIAVLAVVLLVTGFTADAQSGQIEEIQAQIDALMEDFDKSAPDPAVLAQLEVLYDQYAAASPISQGTNDDCANAIPIGCNVPIAYSTMGATDDGNFSCGLGGNEIWFSLTTAGGGVLCSTCNNADYDTVLNASDGTCGALNEVACNDDAPGCGLTSEINFAAVAGTTYLIGVGGFNGDTGTGTLMCTCTDVPVTLQGFDVE